MHLGDGRNQVMSHLCKRVELTAKGGSVDERQNEYWTHFHNLAYSVHHPFDSTNGPFPCVRSVNRLLGFIGAADSNQSLLLWSVFLGGCRERLERPCSMTQ